VNSSFYDLPLESSPDNLRAAAAIFSLVNWILSFSAVFLCPAAVAQVGAFSILMFFAVVAAVGGLFGVVVLTRGK
jgi:hypothetical protein